LNPSPAAPAPAEPSASWLEQRERGLSWLMAASFRLATVCGRGPMKLPVAAVALWYCLFDRTAARASRQWLAVVFGRPARFAEVYRHLRTFSQVTLDRVFLLTGKTRGLRFDRHGREHLTAQVATGRGAMLLGAHLGSYEAMRAGGADDRVPIQIVGHFANARQINALLSRLDPTQAAQVIHLEDDPVGAMARVRARLELGDLVAAMGDRVGLSDRSERVTFFGRPAAFATGPFLLAHLLRCPVYLVFGLYREPGTYELHCEPFAERVDLPRGVREEALRQLVVRYAARVEHHARRAPFNWFNFFDFWSAR
jgi:predicted LPLAT superfamily acyltransferase